MTPSTVQPRALPPELMAAIFNYFELHDLVAPLATSRDWRRAVLDHPTFWRCIHLKSATDSAIDFFLSRVSQARKRRFKACVEADRSCPRIADEVLPAMAARFDQLLDFAGAVHHDQMHALFDTLRRPAPVLERFQIFIIRPAKAPLLILPTDVFCGVAPKLTFVGFRDTGVAKTLYPAFANVVDVDFGFTRAETFHIVPHVFSVFPRMRRFGLYSGDVDVPENLQFPFGIPSDMEAVECVMKADSFDVMVGVLPYHAISTVRVAGVAADTVEFFTSHLHGPLALEVSDRRAECAELFDLTVTSTETGFKRIFGQSARRYLANVKPPIVFLRDNDFAERLVALTIPNVLWGFLARHFLPFPNLKELSIRLDTPHLPVLGQTWRVSCAKLQTLRLVANTVDPLYIPTERLAAFVALSLADLPSLSTARPVLELDAVILDGDSAVLSPYLILDGDSAVLSPYLRLHARPTVHHPVPASLEL